MRCNSKTTWGNLFYSGISIFTVFTNFKSVSVFSSFTWIRFTPNSIHCNCQIFMSLSRYWSIRHCSCLKSLNNFCPWFHFIYGYRIQIIKFEKTSYSHIFFRLIIYCFGVNIITLLIIKSYCLLKFGNSSWIKHMSFSISSPPVISTNI